jgi:2-methylisocitrate lyase-like PEP mutase family enzyme
MASAALRALPTARAVGAGWLPGVATTSGGVAATLGYEDPERGPGEEMLAAAARIARGVEVPVTVDAEAGYAIALAGETLAGSSIFAGAPVWRFAHSSA